VIDIIALSFPKEKSMEQRTISQETVVRQLLDLGVQPGGVLLVHCAFSKVKPIEGGPAGLITALQKALGPEGTLVMPSMSWDDEHPFDPLTTSCREEMGIVADTFWRQPGVLRSNSPHACAAAGPHAAEITRPHPVEIPHGPDSPVGRVADLNGQVLLLGVGHPNDTTIHLGEFLAGVRYRLPVSLVIRENGQLKTVSYGEINHCCKNFSFVDGWLDELGLQRRGKVGNAEARLARSCDILRVVVDHLRENETTFLHPPGVDEECDEARASIPSGG